MTIPAPGSDPAHRTAAEDSAAAGVSIVAARWAASAGAVAAVGLVRGAGRPAERAASDEVARRLLSALAGDETTGSPPVERSGGGRPLWPAGVRASLAHAASVAVGVAGRADRWHALGVDLEVEGALPAVDATAVLTDHELRWAVRASGSLPTPGSEVAGGADVGVTRLWSAKEAGFKAWCGALDDDLPGVDPLDIAVWPGVEAGTFALRCGGTLAGRLGAIGPLSGRWLTVPGSGLVLTVAWR